MADIFNFIDIMTEAMTKSTGKIEINFTMPTYACNLNLSVQSAGLNAMIFRLVSIFKAKIKSEIKNIFGRHKFPVIKPKAYEITNFILERAATNSDNGKPVDEGEHPVSNLSTEYPTEYWEAPMIKSDDLIKLLAQ